MIPRIALCAAIALAAAVPALALADRTERVRFARGATSAELRGEVRGYDFVDYLVGARAGQRLSLSLARTSGHAFFLVRAPGSDDNLFDGSSAGDRFETVLPGTGDYRVRVLMMRAFARRNERSAYRLRVAIR